MAEEDLVAIWTTHPKVPAALIIKDVPTWNFGLPCRRRGKNPRRWKSRRAPARAGRALRYVRCTTDEPTVRTALTGATGYPFEVNKWATESRPSTRNEKTPRRVP